MTSKLEIARSQKKPVKFLASRLLMRSGLCRLITMDMGGFRLRFFPSALSAQYWIDRQDRSCDTDFIARYVKPGDNIIDIGANIGALALAAAAAAGRQGHVLAAEPHPRIYGYLVSNIELNGFVNITPVNAAAAANGTGVRISDSNADDENRLSDEGIDVPARALDDMARLLYGEIALLKIDTEGCEKFVLDGGAKTLARTSCVYFESCQSQFARYGYTCAELFNSLEAAEFSVYRKTGDTVLERLPEGYISSKCENLFALKNEEMFSSRTGWTTRFYK
ncbi:MAG: FkbM family methyltransferase [Elusimicrobiales bacterium]